MKSFAPAFAGFATLTLLAALGASPAHAEPASCSKASEQLADSLDGAMRRVGREAELTAEFEVDAQGRVQRPMVQGERGYRWPVRLAVEMLDCQAGTPQRYVVSIRFTDPAHAAVQVKPPITIAVAASAPR